MYFVIMENVFNTSNEVHVRYDIKGSRYKRKLDKESFLQIIFYNFF